MTLWRVILFASLLSICAGCSTRFGISSGGSSRQATVEKRWGFEEFGQLLAGQWSGEAPGRFEVYPVSKEQWQQFSARHQGGDQVWLLAEGRSHITEYFCLVRAGSIVIFFKYEIGDISKARG